MTNGELISKIKAETERLKEEAYNSISPDEPKYRTYYKVGKKELCEELLSFLSTLESEKPIPNDLEEAADEYEERVIEETKCHHNALLTYANGYEDALLLIPGAFIDGAKWQKEQMMKGAVDTVVSLDAGGFPFIEFGVGKFGLKVGDKVRIIIVKENEQC